MQPNVGFWPGYLGVNAEVRQPTPEEEQNLLRLEQGGLGIAGWPE